MSNYIFIIIIIILFLKHRFLPRSAKVRRLPRYEASPHIPENCLFRVQTKLVHVILHTFPSCLPTSAHTSHPSHHHISTGRHPIISVLTFHMPKPPQSTMPHHFCHALNTQKTVQVLTSLPIPSETHHTSISPSYVLFSPGYADSQPSLPMSQSHISTHSGHRP